MAVFVLDKRKKPLMPCSEKRARLLLERGRARIHKMIPFTIRLIDRLQETSDLQAIRLKIDPGSKSTGMALVREKETTEPSTGRVIRDLVVIMLLELQHRGDNIRNALSKRKAFRNSRRSKLRHRPARFFNRTKPSGWLPPSLKHRVDSTISWVHKLLNLAPVSALSQELVKFDTQAIQNPSTSGVAYQLGDQAGYEIREYLFAKWGRKCVYCDATQTPLQLDHIYPRSKGGSNRASNLVPACPNCNQKKGNLPIEQFLAHSPEKLRRILAHSKSSLRNAAAVNSTRFALYEQLQSTGLSVEQSTGGRTKWNRTQLRLPKTHCIDAVCVGQVDSVKNWRQPWLIIKATGRGSYQRTRLNKYGFPRGYLTRSKSAFGFQTGDMVKAIVPIGKKKGSYLGRVAIRTSGGFNIQDGTNLIQGISYKFCKLIQRSDGYGYSLNKPLNLLSLS